MIAHALPPELHEALQREYGAPLSLEEKHLAYRFGHEPFSWEVARSNPGAHRSDDDYNAEIVRLDAAGGQSERMES